MSKYCCCSVQPEDEEDEEEPNDQSVSSISTAHIRALEINQSKAKWHECIKALIECHAGQDVSISLDIEIIVFFDNGKTQKVIQTFIFVGIVDEHAVACIVENVESYMNVPHVQINDRIHYLRNVFYCKFGCIKNFCIR